jgi:RNA recognition motif-containing protein
LLCKDQAWQIPLNSVSDKVRVAKYCPYFKHPYRFGGIYWFRYKGGIQMNIFVGNLAREVTEEDIKAEFTAFGEISSIAIIKDKFSGQPRGFAFVEMPNKEEGAAALAGLKGKMLKNRTLDISEARPRTENRGGGGRSFGGGGGRSGGSSLGKRKPPRRR